MEKNFLIQVKVIEKKILKELKEVSDRLEKNENEKDAQLAMKKIDEIMKITAELERRNADGDKKAEEELEKWSKDIEELDIKF